MATYVIRNIWINPSNAPQMLAFGALRQFPLKKKRRHQVTRAKGASKIWTWPGAQFGLRGGIKTTYNCTFPLSVNPLLQ
jgi:hypothetical protein